MQNIITGLATNVTNVDNIDYGLAFAYILGALLIIGLIALFNYLYNALALYSIAKKNGEEYSWFAFIPLADTYLWHTISKTPLWMFIVVIGFSLISGALSEIPGTLYMILLLIPLPIFINSIWHGNAAKSMNYSFWLGFSIPIIKALSFTFLIFGSLAFYLRETLTDTPMDFIIQVRNFTYVIALLLYILSMVLLGIIAWKKKESTTPP
jgi:hypothetical protein